MMINPHIWIGIKIRHYKEDVRMKTATPIRVIPSGKVYRQIFDAEV